MNNIYILINTTKKMHFTVLKLFFYIKYFILSNNIKI